MNYADTKAALDEKRRQVEALQAEMRAIQAQVEPEVVQNYLLDGWEGPVRLSDLFGGKRDLIVIHNMGTSCSSCTMWADGFNGVYDHLASRAAFVVSSPNPVAVQKKFAASRGWRFPMISHATSSFARDLGYWREEGDACQPEGGWWPGISVLRRDGDRIVRVSDTELGPGDGFCVVYSLFDLVPGSDLQWEPKYSYA